MNLVGKFSLGLTAAVGLSLATRAVAAAEDTLAVTSAPAAGSDTPYATIQARNIFGLVPIPPPPPPPAPPEDPPPKITANGIMNVFGELEALFKVSIPAKGSVAAKDQSYMLSEGQRQDDIEVTKIDEKAATITFNNHGTTQEIPLVVAKDTGAPSTGPTGGTGGGPQPGGFNPGGAGTFRRPMGGFFGGFNNPVPSPMGNNNSGFNNPGLNNNNGANASIPSSGGAAAPAAANQNPAGDMTPEQQALLIEAQRAQLEDTPKPAFNPALLPPTKYGGSAPPPP